MEFEHNNFNCMLVLESIFNLGKQFFLKKMWKLHLKMNPISYFFQKHAYIAPKPRMIITFSLHVQIEWIKLRMFSRISIQLARNQLKEQTRYTRVTAFGNHFRADDESSASLRSYNSGIASVFEETFATSAEISVNYVGAVKDVLQLDYGALNLEIILLRC